MRIFQNAFITFCLALLAAGCAGSGQNAATTLVNPEGTVTFRLRAEEAKAVTVAGDTGALAMTKGDHDVWSVTTVALAPAIYRYYFEVDGQRVADPAAAERLSATESLLTVPGDPPMPWERRAIPHGTITRQTYQSPVFGMERSYSVYTPPGYSTATAPLPVLFLLHGFGNDDQSCSTVGKADLIADSLLADGRIKPMLIVMPYGQPRPESSYQEAFADPFQEKFARQLLAEIMPAVEKDYRVSSDPRQRAIAGVSMGGMQAAYIGLNHPGTFATLGIWSPAIFGDPAALLSGLAISSETQKRSFARIDLAVGQQDDLNLLPRSETLDAFLNAQGVAHTFRPTPGTHSWLLWRGYLVDFLGEFSDSAR